MSHALLQPVLLGGLFMGVLSSLPFISVGNCCCLWVTGGGVVTAYLIQHGREDSVQLGQGAFGGFLSGIVGAVIIAFAGLIMLPFTGNPFEQVLEQVLQLGVDVPPEARDILKTLSSLGGVWFVLLGFFFWLAVGMVFSTLGGLVGTLIFRKTPPATPAAPPPPSELRSSSPR